MITSKNEKAGYRYSASALKGSYLKKIKGYEAWFYTGPSLNFGHVQRPPKQH